MKYVEAKFEPFLQLDRAYTYATELDLQVGDHCITIPNGKRLAIVRITKVDVDKPLTFKCKVLEQKVDGDLSHKRTV